MASRYSRYDSDRRSRSPRDRSPDRFDVDRRRPSAEVRSNANSFQSNRDSFGDGPRREPPRGPRALIDAPNGPRGGGFGGEFRGRGRGRGRGWSSRDESRDRGRDRENDFRDRFRDDRSRERERDWRADPYRLRRSPIGRARSPPRDFRDRERDAPGGPDLPDRPRRNSRDGAPLSGGSPSAEPPFGMPLTQRGGFMPRGRGRGGRGDWNSDRGRGRASFDDRGDRYLRSRSQEGRWGRERDDRDRVDRYPESDVRRVVLDDHNRGDTRELFREKMQARAASVQEPPVPSKDISPPPLAPSAPAFGSVPHRNQSIGEAPMGIPGIGKPPPTAPRAFVERQPSGLELCMPPSGPSKALMHDNQSIPVGPRAQQQKAQRPSSKQWINPNLKKIPDSPKMMRPQSFQQRPGPPRHDSVQNDHPANEWRPRSSDSKASLDLMNPENRRRARRPSEPGEIFSKPEDDWQAKTEWDDARRMAVPKHDIIFKNGNGESSKAPAAVAQLPKVTTRRRKRPVIKAVRFLVPPKPQPVADQGSESDDDEDMGDYFAMEIDKVEAELSKLQSPKLPHEVVERYAAMSHGSMVKILNESDGLRGMLDPPEDLLARNNEAKPGSLVEQDVCLIQEDGLAPQDEPNTQLVPDIEATKNDNDASPELNVRSETKSGSFNQQEEPEEMDIDNTPKELPQSPPRPATPPIPSAPPAPPAPPTLLLDAEIVGTETATEEPSGIISLHPMAADQRTSPPPLENKPTASLLPEHHPEPMEMESKLPSTPSQAEEDGDETETDDEGIESADSVCHHMTTPPIDSLPIPSVRPWTEDEAFKASLDDDHETNDYILDQLESFHLWKREGQQRDQRDYADRYMCYLKFTSSDDPTAKKSRDKLTVPGPPPDPVGPVTPEPKPEGRTTGRRFASERDLERVLQASMREEDERREREARMQKEKYRGEKEAVIPDMYWCAEEKDELQYRDRAGHVSPDRLLRVWQVLPPVDNFSQEETELFEKRYLELPKQWGKVAEVVPNRDFGTCIQYYYLKKKDLNLKEKLKKQPKKRKKGGRGKQRSSALVSELGNADPDGDDTTETGENGENRRRPRRAAAPTWGFEQPPTESENGTPVSTPGRRGGLTASKGDQLEKVDGRKGRRKGAKEKEPKLPKPNQTLAAAPATGAGRSRARSDGKGQNIEFQASLPGDPHRLLAHFEQQHSGMQPPFSIQQSQYQQSVQGLERPSPHVSTTSITDVMAAPSLRPEPPQPPPQPVMSTFNLAQPQQERKVPTQASSYWSVSESNDFPHLLKAFGSDWNAIAAHMGSKTPVMVKNYYVRQKDQGKSEWEDLVNEAEAKRNRGEKRPEPPQPTIGGRGRRYDTVAPGSSRPLAAAPGLMDPLNEQPQPKTEPGQPTRPHPFMGYGVPLAQAPSQQQPLAAAVQQPLAIQQQPSVSQPTSQAMSPALRAPLEPFGFPHRSEREQTPQRVPLPGSKVPGAPINSREQRERSDSQRERIERDLERDMTRQVMRAKQDMDVPPRHHYETFGHRPQGMPSREPLSLSRHAEPARHGGPQTYAPVQHAGGQVVRNLQSDPQTTQSPPLGPPVSRPISTLQQRQSAGPGQDLYRASSPASSAPIAAPPRSAPEPPAKRSNIMALLNDDLPSQPKRVSDVASNPRPSPTPPPLMGRPPPGHAPPSQLRRETESYTSYGRAPSGAASAMPPLKPTTSYTASPGSQHGGPRSSLGMGVDSPASDRDYFRQHPYGQGHPSSGTNSPQTTPSHRYTPSGGPGQIYQSPSGYPTSYGSTSQPPNASSPPPQFAMHGSSSRSREVPQGGRESWPPPGHGQTTSSWATSQPAKNSQHPPPQHQQSWGPQHPSSKAGTPTGAWATAPPPQQQHHNLRDDRGPPIYGSTAAQQEQQRREQQHREQQHREQQHREQQHREHQQQLQARYGPPSSRGPEQVPPPAQAYPRYASTPGPGPPRDPRDIPQRSYTPGGYSDARGPTPQPGPVYPGSDPRGPADPRGPDPRDVQLRDHRELRDQRDMIARGLRPHDYDRHLEHYGR